MIYRCTPPPIPLMPGIIRTSQSGDVPRLQVQRAGDGKVKRAEMANRKRITKHVDEREKDRRRRQ